MIFVVKMDDSHAKTVCLFQQGEKTCRYLTFGADGFGCGKKTAAKYTIDREAARFRAKGDNCDGLMPPHDKVAPGSRGTYREDGDAFAVEVLEDVTDADGVKLNLKIVDGGESGREFQCFHSWDAGAYGGMWHLSVGERSLP